MKGIKYNGMMFDVASFVAKNLWLTKKIDIYHIKITKDKYVVLADQTVNGEIITLVEVSNKIQRVAYEKCIKKLISDNIITEDELKKYMI